MGRYATLSVLVGMLAMVSAQDSSTTSTTTETTSETSSTVTVVPTTVSTDVTTVIDSTTTTVSSETVISTTITLSDVSTTDDATSTTAETTVITTTTFTDVTTVSDSTTTVTQSPTETVTTVTITPSSSSTLTTTGSSTTTNAPQYTGATFHLESSEGDLGEGAMQAGTTRQDLVFGIRTEFTLNGFGYLVSRADGSVAQTNGGGDTVYTDTAPNSRVKRQATGTPLECSVGTNGILACTGAGGDVFYTDGTNLYLGAAVPAGFTPITLIAVIDAPLVPTSGTVSPTGPLPTVGPTTPGYVGWGQWSYPTPTGVPVALTTTCVYPISGGLVTETVTITSLHCGCTETPIPSSVVMTTYLTTCPDSWGYTAPVTVVVPVKPTGAVWATASGSYDNSNGGSGWSAYASGPSGAKPTGNGTYNSWNGKTYTGAASPMGVSAGLLSLSAAMLALFL